MPKKRSSKLRELIGAMKDKVSQSRAAVVSDSATACLLRATSHDPHAPASPQQLSALLSVGNGSRAAASPVVRALMERLQVTRDAHVALKCLIAAHHIIVHGSFIAQDQLSVFPASGGRNYLNLSKFRDASTPLAWELSDWVRWLAHLVEALMCTSRVLGFFPSSTLDKEHSRESLPSVSNRDLVLETDSLVGLIEVACRRPDSVSGNRMVSEVEGLVSDDLLSATSEIGARVREFGERVDLGHLGFGDSVELICLIKRLEDCKGKVVVMVKKEGVMLMEGFWDSIAEMKKRVWGTKLGYEKRLVGRDRRRVSESARFGDRVLRSGELELELGRFPSGRIQFRNLDSAHHLCPR